MIYLVCGVTGSGKSTYIEKNKGDNICFDFDKLYNSLFLKDDRVDSVVDFLHNDLRKHIIENCPTEDIFVSRCVPTDEEMEYYNQRNATIVPMIVSKETIVDRLTNRDGQAPADLDEQLERFDAFLEKYCKDEKALKKNSILRKL